MKRIFVLIWAAALLPSCGFVLETDLLTFSPAYTDWWDEAWSSRRQLIFDNSAQGEDLQDFPVLVRLNSSRIDYGKTQDGGEDLRFIDANGSSLSYEIESWDEAGESVVWVKVQQIDGLSNSDYIWMYYGNDAASEGQNPQGVWDNGYEVVLHMGEQSGNFSDSTGNNRYGQPSGVTQGVTGKIGRAAQFNGTSDYVALNMSYTGPYAVAELTVGVWFNTTFSGSSYNDNWAFVDFDRSDFYNFYIAGDSRALELSTSSQGSVTDDFLANTTSLNDGLWYLGWAVYDGTDSRIYLNASLDGTSLNPHNGNGLGINSSTRWGIVGDGSEATGFDGSRNNIYYEGSIDEIRISHVARTDDWISAQYASMNDSFLSFTEEQSL